MVPIPDDATNFDGLRRSAYQYIALHDANRNVRINSKNLEKETRKSVLDLKVTVAEGKILEHLKVKARKSRYISLKTNIEHQADLKKN